MNIYDSPYLKYANKTLNWLPMDTEIRYNTNFKENHNKLKEFGWDSPSNAISYHFNEHGFRSDDFSHSSSVLFLGCSLTLGIGVPYEKTWAYLVSKSLNLANYNLGIGGGSNDTAFRLGHYWIPKLMPKLVVWKMPDQDRIELLDRNEAHRILMTGKNYSPWADYYKIYVSQNFNGTLNRQKNLLAVTHICQNLNIPLVTMDNHIPRYDFGRDLAHPGIKSNQFHANTVIDLINQKFPGMFDTSPSV